MTNKLTAKEIVDLNKEYTFFSWSNQGQVNPIPVTKAEGVYFWDADGKRYLDFASQLVNENIGHQHPKVVKAIQDQAAVLAFVSPGMATEPRGLLGKKLAEITPGDLKKTFFSLGGAEANENAIKIARQYTGRHKILARYRSYHGATHGAIALTGDYRRLPAEPAISGVVHFLDPYCYRCPFGWTKDTCHRECISHVEEVIQHEGPDQIAAIILEGVTGTNGLIIPPDEYWPRMREICDKYGILLISDEVMSGWGRTGEWFAVDNWNVTPDIITTAKGITSGYVPLGAVIVSEKIANYFDSHMLSAGLTYNGHALACATALATIAVYEEENIFENAKTVGKYLGEQLEELKTKHVSIGDVRYIGMFTAMELVKNRVTKEPMDLTALKNFLIANGVYVFNFKNILFIVPPLTITKEQIDEGLKLIDEGLAELMDTQAVQ
ncbi:MAG: aminotransferase class III-fold pyridoxal phosphate-dependent enzyme [Anaerolineales bacterium]|nr:aminotransferase class III-fold pyridoxal phosphate-dependent enzyme [Anaerolineales bacterium]